ncbi:MAG: ribokinase [candidate division WOR-3 bacterium]|nr:ribokinase [candidate division WOR-3 bacterium]
MKNKRAKICVVGSFMTDMVFRVKRLPRPGESMAGDGFGLFLGGKGFNQALAAHRLGADVVMVGKVGMDYYGELFLKKMKEEGMRTDFVAVDPEVPTGVACPMIDSAGQNAIIGVAGANLRLGEEQIAMVKPEIEAADALMLQFEIPHRVSFQAATIARNAGCLVFLDPAPFHKIELPIKEPVDYIVPNEIEAAELAGGMAIDDWAKVELKSGRRAVIISVGADGALVFDENGKRRFPPFKVKAIDSTGAGDAFRAGLAVSIAEGRSLDEAVRFANACGAIACTVLGAEPSMPRREEVERLLKEQEV